MNWIKKIFGLDNKETLICSLEKIYNDLRIKNPDKDEHWFLANTWMAKYGNWEASKQKGPKLTRYIAYTTTFQYSILDTPKSIRGLALFLAYKERGDKEAEDEIAESAQIIELIQNMGKGGKLLDEYKRKNPFTWNEIEREGDESIHGLYGFLKSADYLNKNPEEDERLRKEFEEFERRGH